MLLLLSLMAFAPRDGALPSGPPVVHLDSRAAVQWRLDARDPWLEFQDLWGGPWSVRWDERNGTPRFLGAPGVDLQQAPALVADVARLAGVDPRELSLSRDTRHDSREIQHWTRTWHGAEVQGDYIAIVATSGHIGAVWARLTPIRGLPWPQPGESVLAIGDRATPVLARRQESETEIRWTDRSGQAVLAYDPRHFATLDVEFEQRTIGDALVTGPARRVTVTDSAGTVEVTDDDGVCSLSGDLTVDLDGPSLVVRSNGADVSVSGTDDFTITAGGSVPMAVPAVQNHYYTVFDWLESRWPTHGLLGLQVQADALLFGSGSCNAWYTGGTITFLPGAPGSCYDAGRVADIVFHEVGHGVHDYIMATGSFASDVSEGSADFVAATILDDAYVSRNWLAGTPYLRELDTDKVYPTDVTGESHNDGLIWGSFLWDLRELWSADYGAEAGVEMTDLLFLGALEQGPELTDLYEAVLVADDDDGDWSNGTPHECELVTLLDKHGLGPGPLGLVTLNHTPLEAQASATAGYALNFELYSSGSECIGAELGAVELWYSTDEDATIPSGLSGPEWSAWSSLALTQTDDTWTGTLPRVAANLEIRYFIQVVSVDETQIETTHDGVDEGLYRFWVGDRSELWCDDLESGGLDWSSSAGLPGAADIPPELVDDWAIGSLEGGRFDPETAYSGSYVAATALDGEYTASNASTLYAPEQTLTGSGLMRLLSFRRALTVEDALYDQAGVWAASGEGSWRPLWTNPNTPAGTTHILDESWIQRDHSLADILAEDGSLDEPLRLAWSLSSDGGLEYGGWTLDDVCLIELADPAGHYRAAGLSLEQDDSAATLRWTTPWIHPLLATVLVRKQGGWPEDADDGVIVALDLSPDPGEAHELVEPLDTNGLVEGSTWYYAVFAAGRDDADWWTDINEGENGAVLDLPAPVVDTGDSGDTGDTAADDTGDQVPDDDTGAPDTADTDKDGGCGCSSGAPSGLFGSILGTMLSGLLLIRRRRRAT